VPEAEAPVKWKLSNSYTHSGTNNGKAMENSWKYEIYYIFIYIYINNWENFSCEAIHQDIKVIRLRWYGWTLLMRH
jgi:hypothetical protein